MAGQPRLGADSLRTTARPQKVRHAVERQRQPRAARAGCIEALICHTRLVRIYDGPAPRARPLGVGGGGCPSGGRDGTQVRVTRTTLSKQSEYVAGPEPARKRRVPMWPGGTNVGELASGSEVGAGYPEVVGQSRIGLTMRRGEHTLKKRKV